MCIVLSWEDFKVAAQKNEGQNFKERIYTAKKGTRSSRILAKSFYNELKTNGFTRNDILVVSSEILELVTNDIKQKEF